MVLIPKEEGDIMWTFFVLNFDKTYSNYLPKDSGVPPLVYLVPKDKVKVVIECAKRAQSDFWDDDSSDGTEIDESFEKYLSDNHIEFRVVGSIDLTYGERKGQYLDNRIPNYSV